MQNKTVLVVDDEPNIVTSLAFLLKKEGYSVVTAADGHQAIKQYQRHKPDIILLDVMMPGKDGLETSKSIRALDSYSRTRIIFLTARGAATDRQLGYMSGADDYVVKPFDNQMILEKIEEKAL